MNLMKITIQQYIEAQEDEPVGYDLFYARLLGVTLAADDGVDLDGLEPAEEC